MDISLIVRLFKKLVDYFLISHRGTRHLPNFASTLGGLQENLGKTVVGSTRTSVDFNVCLEGLESSSNLFLLNIYGFKCF